MVQEKGGIMKVKNSSDIPRNRMQISNFNRSPGTNNDDLATLILKCKQQSVSPGTAFVREVGAAPEVYAFLANNWQLNDIQRFCTNDENCSILGIDMTFYM